MLRRERRGVGRALFEDCVASFLVEYGRKSRIGDLLCSPRLEGVCLLRWIIHECWMKFVRCHRCSIFNIALTRWRFLRIPRLTGLLDIYRTVCFDTIRFVVLLEGRGDPDSEFIIFSSCTWQRLCNLTEPRRNDPTHAPTTWSNDTHHLGHYHHD